MPTYSGSALTPARLAEAACQLEAQSRHFDAIDLCTRHVDANPHDHAAWVWLARSLLRVHRTAQASVIVNSLLTKDAAMPAAMRLKRLVKGFKQQITGQPLAALETLTRYVSEAGDDPLASTRMATALIRLNRPQEAEDVLKSVLRDRPDFVEAQLQLARLHDATGGVDEACKRAVETLFVEVNALDELGRQPEATDLLRAYFQGHIDDLVHMNALANALLRTTRWGNAEKIINQVLLRDQANETARQLALLHNGLRLSASGKPLDSVTAFTAYLGAHPGDAFAWTQLAQTLMLLGQRHQAEAILASVIRDHPNYGPALSALASRCFSNGDHQRAIEFADRAYALNPCSYTNLMRAQMQSHAAGDPALTMRLYSEWGQRYIDHCSETAPPLPKLGAKRRSPSRRLRIGYVSADLREHPIAFFMEPVLAHHDPESVEVFVYNTCSQPDTRTERIKRAVPHWHDVAALDTLRLWQLIRKHRIDVLIDLSGHTEGNRLEVFAHRAAPVQLTWLGYIHTLGMKAMDYRLTDAEIDPPGNDAHYVETLFRLSRIGVYQPPEVCALEGSAPMLSEGSPTLASLNHARKVTDEMLLLWGRILQARPDARLLLISSEGTDEKAKAAFLPRLERLNLPVDRIGISPRLQLNAFMALGTLVDVALDTAPVSGGTTTLHTLWMGLPVVTLDATEAIQAYTASLLRGLGLGDWVARDADDYVAKVLALLDSPEVLNQHRADIRTRMKQSALMNYALRTREIEHAYRLMWINHLIGERRFLHASQDMDEAIGVARAHGLNA